MTPEIREILIRTAGIIDGLYFTASDGIKEALGVVAENLECVLMIDERQKNEQKK